MSMNHPPSELGPDRTRLYVSSLGIIVLHFTLYSSTSDLLIFGTSTVCNLILRVCV